MNSDIHQYYMYGTIISYEQYDEWKNIKGKGIADILNETDVIVDDISCVFSGRDGKFLIIGKILKEFNEDAPIVIKELTRTSEIKIEDSVYKNFSLKSKFYYYFVKTYK